MAYWILTTGGRVIGPFTTEASLRAYAQARELVYTFVCATPEMAERCYGPAVKP